MPLSNADSRSLVSRVTNLVLTRLREIDEPFRSLSEDGQRRVAMTVTNEAQDIIRDLVHLVSADGFPFEPVKVKKLTDGGATPEMTVQLVGTDIDWQRLHAIAKQEVTLVMLPPSRFDEVREQPEIDADEPGLPLPEGDGDEQDVEDETGGFALAGADGEEEPGEADDDGEQGDEADALADDRQHLEEIMTEAAPDPIDEPAAEAATDPIEIPVALKRPSREERAKLYQEGAEAYDRGEAATNCRHPSASWQAKSWSQGWADRQNGMAA